MEHNINYSSLYLNKREKILLQSILSFHNANDACHWIPTDIATAMVIIVGNQDVELDDVKQLNTQITAQQIILSLNDTFISAQSKQIIYLPAPIGAKELLDKIIAIENMVFVVTSAVDEQSQATIEPDCLEQSQQHVMDNMEQDNQTLRYNRIDPHQKIKLLQWPSTDLLYQHSLHANLANLLNNRQLSIKELATLTQQPLMVCRQFTKQLLEMGYAELVNDLVEKSIDIESPSVTESDNSNAGLLKRVKSVLGFIK